MQGPLDKFSWHRSGLHTWGRSAPPSPGCVCLVTVCVELCSGGRALGGRALKEHVGQVSAGLWPLAREGVPKEIFCPLPQSVLTVSLLGSGDKPAFLGPLVERATDTDGQVQLAGPDSWRREGRPTELGVAGCFTLWGRRRPGEGTREIRAEAPRVGGSQPPGWRSMAGSVADKVQEESRGQVGGRFTPRGPLEVLGGLGSVEKEELGGGTGVAGRGRSVLSEK